MKNPPPWLKSAKEIGDFIGVHKDRVKRLVDEDDLPAKIVFRKWRALPDDVLEWMKKKLRDEMRMKP